ncbi:hypothetical protein [Pseudoxanthomonas winnipegensis]|nr:hypothetical protein [Pseudoxanthomonas winnipegensis]
MSGKRTLRYATRADMPPGVARAVDAHDARQAVAPRPYKPVPAAKQGGDLAAGKTVARARPRHVAGEMNKTEAAYAQHLDARIAAGEVLWWKFEAIRLQLAPKTTLTVDFFVQLANSELEAHEVKGYWEEDARVKVKVAAALFPFRFIAVQKDGSSWKFEDFG